MNKAQKVDQRKVAADKWRHGKLAVIYRAAFAGDRGVFNRLVSAFMVTALGDSNTGFTGGHLRALAGKLTETLDAENGPRARFDRAMGFVAKTNERMHKDNGRAKNRAKLVLDRDNALACAADIRKDINACELVTVCALDAIEVRSHNKGAVIIKAPVEAEPVEVAAIEPVEVAVEPSTIRGVPTFTKRKAKRTTKRNERTYSADQLGSFSDALSVALS